MEKAELELDGGDAACWLGRVCTDCGALAEGPASRACWRCAAEAQ